MADFTSALTDRLLADPAVAAIAGTRIHWVKVPQDTPLPYAVLQVISDPRPQHLKDYEGARRSRVQVNCDAPSYGAAKALAAAVIAAVAQPATVSGIRFGRSKAEGPSDQGEDTETGFVQRARVDLLVEHTPA